MDKQQLIEKTTETLRPFETSNLIDTMQHLSLKQIFTHPIILIIIVSIFFYGMFKRSKTIFLSLFSLFAFSLIIRYAMPAPGEDLSFTSTLPFIGCGLFIGFVVIYYSLIKSD